MLLLDIYNIAVNYSTKDNSFRILDRYERKDKLTYGLQHLMMLEKLQHSNRFMDQVCHLYENCDLNLPRFLIKNIAKHAYITMRSLDFKDLDKLNSTVLQSGRPNRELPSPKHKSLLIKRAKNNRKGE